MKVIGEPETSVFPMKIRCAFTVDKNGYSYGNTADYCGRLLEAEEADVKKHGWYKNIKEHGVDYGIICPVCKMFTTIEEDKIPGYVKDKAVEISLDCGKYVTDLD